MSKKTLDAQIEAIMAATPDGVLYLGASWCAPCKAMRPLLLMEADKYPDIPFNELDLSDLTEGFESQYIRALPAFIKISDGCIKTQQTGMLTLKQLQALFADEVQDNKTDEAKGQLQQLLNELKVDEALVFYDQLEGEIKYSSSMQKLKSQCDLIAGARTSLPKINEPKFHTMLKAFSSGQFEAGLDMIVSEDLNDAELRQWYVHGINCIGQSDVAAIYRRKLSQVKMP